MKSVVFRKIANVIYNINSLNGVINLGTNVAIGGGEISTSETYEIDQTIVDLTNKKSPKVLFIPTASMDAEGYCDSFQSYIVIV